MDQVVKIKQPGYWENGDSLYASFVDDPWDLEDDDKLDNYAITIEEAKYVAVTVDKVATQQKHLSEYQQKELARVLNKFPKLFDGKLGHYMGRKVHLGIRKDAIPVYQKPYAVPKSHKEVFKQELKHLCDIGVLQPCGPTEWAAPTFIIPKKDGRV